MTSSVQRTREEYLLNRLGDDCDEEAAVGFIMGNDPDNPFVSVIGAEECLRTLNDNDHCFLCGGIGWIEVGDVRAPCVVCLHTRSTE